MNPGTLPRPGLQHRSIQRIDGLSVKKLSEFRKPIAGKTLRGDRGVPGLVILAIAGKLSAAFRIIS